MEKQIAMNGKIFTQKDAPGLFKWWEQMENYPALKKWTFDWLVVNIPRQVWDEDAEIQKQARELLLNGKCFNKDGSIDKSSNWCLEIFLSYSDDFPELGDDCEIISLRETKSWQ